jgi:predicted nucleic acid-binding protein
VAFVVDASIAVAWVVAGQATEYTNGLLRRAARERLHVPVLWHIEFCNALLVLMHRRKVEPAGLESLFDAVEALDLVTDAEVPAARGLATLARRFALSAHDATYLELAIRLGLPIAAKDAPLSKAAVRAGVLLA